MSQHQFENASVQRAFDTLFVARKPEPRCIDGALHLLLNLVEKQEETTEAPKVLRDAFLAGKIISTKALRRYGTLVAAPNDKTLQRAFDTLFVFKVEQTMIDGALHRLLDLVERKTASAAIAQQMLQDAHRESKIISTTARMRYGEMVAAIDLEAHREERRIQEERLAADRTKRAIKQARNKDNRRERGERDRRTAQSRGSGK